MREVLEAYRSHIRASEILNKLGLQQSRYFLVSAHREETVDDTARLQQLLACLTAVHERWALPVYISTHPRTRKRLEALPDWSAPEGITFHEPFGFHDYNRLQLDAACVLSDSGTIAEESIILRFPAVTLRDAIERPEALDTGGIMLTGLHAEDVLTAVSLTMQQPRPQSEPQEYSVGDTSQRVVRFILSTARRHAAWAGIRDFHRDRG